MAKKVGLAVAFVVIACIFCVCFSACTRMQNDVDVENVVVSRFGDGIKVLDVHSAPEYATEYKRVARVKVKVNVDARMSGYHITGIYLPAGEALTVTVSNTVSQMGYRVHVNSFSESGNIFNITQTSQTFGSEKGGVVEIFVPSSVVSDSSFNMTLEGGIVMPYCRLGRDDFDQIQKGDGKYAILDCVNTRFYVPTDIIYDEEGKCVIDDISSVLLWWQSTLSFINTASGIDSNSRDYTSAIVFEDYNGKIKYDAALRVMRADKSYFEKVLNYHALLEGGAWNLLYAINDYKIKTAGGFQGFISIDMVVDILTCIENAVMTNSSDETLSDKNWLNNAYICLERTKELLSIAPEDRNEDNKSDLMRAFFLNIMHSFGLDKTLEIIVEYGKGAGEFSFDEFGLILSSVLKSDVSLYCETFGITLSTETKNKMAGNKVYVPVQTKFTVGSVENTYSMGYTVPMGAKTTFDFASNTVSLVDGWDVVAVKGAAKQWSHKDGIYYYTPNAKKLVDEFEVSLKNGEYSATLYGKINAEITVATYRIYEGWKFENPSTALAEAIDNYEKRTPNYSGSIDIAGVKPREESDDSVYVLTVTNGCMKVPKSGKYRFYLRNNGRCKVEFGVPKYMFDMFDVSITFTEFTRGHSFDIDLDKDTTYYFNLYLLSMKGECDAVMGIRYIEDDPSDDSSYHGINADVIDSRYLIYKNLSPDDIVKFTPPVIYPTGYGYKEEFYQPYALTADNVASYPEAEINRDIDLALDGLLGTYYMASAVKGEYEFVIDMGEERRMEYLKINARDSIVDAKIDIYVSNSRDFSNKTKIKLDKNQFVAGINIFLFNNISRRYVKFVIYREDESDFVCSFVDLDIGQYFEASEIVPNTSAMMSYMGGWSDVKEYVCINGSLSQSVNKNSVMSFTAKSRQICLYGVKDAQYGKMDVYVDGKLYTTVDLFSETTMTDQLIFAIDFDYPMEHSIKVMPAGNDDVINIDYLAYIRVEEESIDQNMGVLYYVLIIPAAILIALIGAAIADRVSKKKKN